MGSGVTDYRAVLTVFAAHGVEFVVVGGVAGFLHGSGVPTLDLDLVHSREPADLQRLYAALRELGAVYREHLPKRLEPRLEDLALPGHHLLMTRFGSLDLLGTIAGGRGYDELLEHSAELELADGLLVCVIDLDMLIRVKEETGREKDRAVLPLLRRLLEERERRS